MNAKNIVFFDGYCHICDGFVSFLLAVDIKRKLRYAALEGETARKLAVHNTETVTFFKEPGKSFERSDAVLEILSTIFPLLKPLSWLVQKVLPQKIRDYMYNFIARNRYKVFGKRETCRLPTPEERESFLP